MGYQKDQRPRNVPKVKLRGAVETINSQSITVLQEDDEGKILLATGTAAAATQDSQSRYAKGAFYIDTDVAGGTAGLYQNVGTSSSSSFSLIGSGDIESVAASYGLLGGGLSGALTMSVGLEIYNDTGGTLTAGTLVAVDAYDTTNGITVVKADADNDLPATHVVVADISNLATGNVHPVATVTGLNTGGRTIGDKVYLDAVSAGTFVFAPFSAAGEINQIVGVVKVVDAVNGEIEFFPGARYITKFPTSAHQDGSITGAKASTALKTKVVYNSIEGLSAASEEFNIFAAPTACTITKIRIISDTATSGSDGSSNYAFQVSNHTQTNNLLSTPLNTNGAEIPANAVYDLTPDQNLTLAANDILQLESTKTGAPTDLSGSKMVVQIEYTVAA